MWTKLVSTTALLTAVTLAGPLTGAAHAAPTPPPVGGDSLGSRGLVKPAGIKAPPKTKATSYVIADHETGQVLAARNAHGRYLPASTLKMLTALTLIPKLDKDLTVKPSRNAVNQEGSAVGLRSTPIYKVDDLFKALMMSSGNDAAMALAEANGGLDRTMADMNAEAKRLQANDTVAKTPSGLDKPGQSSSAYDLALIARAGLANAEFRRYISTKTAKFPAPKKVLRDQQPQQAAVALQGHDRRQERLDLQGPGRLRRRGHPERPHDHRRDHEAHGLLLERGAPSSSTGASPPGARSPRSGSSSTRSPSRRRSSRPPRWRARRPWRPPARAPPGRCSTTPPPSRPPPAARWARPSSAAGCCSG